MKLNNNYFLYYLYGYLNCYYTSLKFTNGKDYFQHKLDETCNYLKLRKNAFVKSFFKLVARIEPVISFLIVTYYFIVELIKVPFFSKKSPKSKYFFYNDNKDIRERLDSADIDKNKLIAINKVTGDNETNFCEYIDVLSIVSFKNICLAYIMSIRMVFFLTYRYGKKDILFRSYSSFEFFLLAFFLDGLHDSNTFIFDDLIDRRAQLGGHLKINTCFIQHGLVQPDPFLIKIGHVSCAYYIDEKQKDICEKFLFNNKPKSKYQKNVFEMTEAHLLFNNRLNVMLVCNLLFFDKEKEIISAISNERVNFYVKPHPKDDPKIYFDLNNSESFVVLGANDYPKVDIVISYDSTLATKYEQEGVKVIRYDSEGIGTCIEYIHKESLK